MQTTHERTTVAYHDKENGMVWYLCSNCHNRTDIRWEMLKPADKKDPKRRWAQPCHGCQCSKED